MTRQATATARITRFAALHVLVFFTLIALPASGQESGGELFSKFEKESALRQVGSVAQLIATPETAGVPMLHDSAKRKASAADSGSISFLPVVTYSGNGTSPTYTLWSLVVGDINGDGKPDLVLTNFNGAGNVWDATHGGFTVLLGNGDGTFQPAQTTYLSQGTSYLAIGDVNADGKPDLVISSCCESNNDGMVAVLLGNGDGTFQAPVNYDSGGEVGGVGGSVALIDLSKNGKLDIVVVNWGGSVGVLMGNGDGTFQPAVTYLADVNTESLGVGDFNGDGKLDLAVIGCCGGGISVLLGNGDGTFQPQQPSVVGDCEQQTLAVGNLNGNHALDLVTAVGGPSNCGPDGEVGVSLGNGSGGFLPSTFFDAGGYSPTSPVIADINGDGIPDVLLADTCGASEGCANASNGSVAILLGNGDGTLQAPLLFATGGSSGAGDGSLEVADVNGDGRPDLIVLNSTQSTIGVLLNSSGASPTTTTITSVWPNPSTYGQAVGFTVQVTSSFGTPTGTVELLNGSTVVGTGTLSSGSTYISTTSLPIGIDSVTAAYEGSADFVSSTSAAVSQTVLTPTTTVLSTSNSTPLIGQPITFTAYVSSSTGTPTGTVTFATHGVHPFTDWKYFGGATLSGGYASITTSSSLAKGTYEVQAYYGGNSTYGGSSSNYLLERNINKYQTTTTVISSESTSYYSQSVTFSATISSTNGPIPDGASVDFYDAENSHNKGNKIGTATTEGGMAVFTTSSLKSGTHWINAVFITDKNFETSEGTATQVVNPYSTLTNLTSSPNPSSYGQAVTWTATVSSSGPDVPTGKVKFGNLGTATLSGGVATLTKTWLNAATYPITAEYEGDDASAPSSSSSLNQVVNPDSTTTTVTSSANPATQGQSVTFTATVTTSTGVNSAGTVTFTAGGTTLGTVTLSENVASISTSALPAGTTSVQAVYSGEIDFKGSTATVSETVNP
jgi:hypothetical protein